MKPRTLDRCSPLVHRTSCGIVAGVMLAIAGGCQTFERRPLALGEHEAAFLARTPESLEVQSFAARLASDRPGTVEFDPTDGITCAEAELIALVFNADLRVARLRAGVTQAAAEHAGRWEDPELGVDLTRIIQGTPEPWKVFSTLSLTIPLSGRLEIEKQRAGIEHAIELSRIAQREWALRMELRRAWSDWSSLDAQLSTTREFVSRVDQIVALVDRIERAGEMARTEARLFRIERATRAADLAALEARSRESELRLRQLMGLSPDAALTLKATGIGPSRVTPMEPTAAAIDQGTLQARSPALVIAHAEYEAAEKALELEIRKQYPDLRIGPGYGREDGQDQILLGLSAPLPVLNGNRRAIAEAKAQREVARASAEAVLEHLLGGTRAAQLRLAAAVQRRQTLESEIVPLVDAQYADARAVVRLGELNTLVLLESLSRQQEAKVKLIDARRDEALAAIELDELLGPEPSGHATEPHAQQPPSGASPSQGGEP